MKLERNTYKPNTCLAVVERTWNISRVKLNFVLTKIAVLHTLENIKPNEDYYMLNRLGNDYYGVQCSNMIFRLFNLLTTAYLKDLVLVINKLNMAGTRVRLTAWQILYYSYCDIMNINSVRRNSV